MKEKPKLPETPTLAECVGLKPAKKPEDGGEIPMFKARRLGRHVGYRGAEPPEERDGPKKD